MKNLCQVKLRLMRIFLRILYLGLQLRLQIRGERDDLIYTLKDGGEMSFEIVAILEFETQIDLVDNYEVSSKKLQKSQP